MNLDSNPVPSYTLPTKPFPVQPPTKIPTGFAPVLPLDKSGLKVRQWRVARREIRGIAGGRWFARSWVGSRDSELAHAASVSSTLRGLEVNEKLTAVAIPKLSAVSISAPVAGKSSGRSRAVKASSLAASAAPSRSSSVVPVPSKMRLVVQAPMSEGDSEMIGPPGSIS